MNAVKLPFCIRKCNKNNRMCWHEFNGHHVAEAYTCDTVYKERMQLEIKDHQSATSCAI